MDYYIELRKLRLEYFKAATSIAGVATLILGVYQLYNANNAARNALDDRLAAGWRDHLVSIYDNSDLRPYFYEGIKIEKSDKNYSKAMMAADIRLEIIDNITNTYDEWPSYEIKTWKNTFDKAFMQSPLLCSRYEETKDNFDTIEEELNPKELCAKHDKSRTQGATPDIKGSD